MECHFCEKLLLVDRDETFVKKFDFGTLFIHRNQSFQGRSLFISNYHFEGLLDISEDYFRGFNKELLLVSKAIAKAFDPALINYASLGNKIRHFHYHIFPRYEYDQNWGGPPWPNVEDIADSDKTAELVALMRRCLEEFEDGEN